MKKVINSNKILFILGLIFIVIGFILIMSSSFIQQTIYVEFLGASIKVDGNSPFERLLISGVIFTLLGILMEYVSYRMKNKCGKK